MVLEDCWVRKGKTGLVINAVGCTLRRCRVQKAASFGVQANAKLAIEGCTIGDCGTSGWGGGIFARAGLLELRQSNGVNENRVQQDHNDKEYNGYKRDCQGCAGQCTCTAMLYDFAKVTGEGLVNWSRAGTGLWQSVGCP